MSRSALRVAVITGANSGIGREIARQLAVGGNHSRVILACRNSEKAGRAKAALENETGKKVFEVLLVDVADVADARRAARSLADGVDDLIMNAGGTGGPSPDAKTPEGVTRMFATNVLGHAALLEELLSEKKLRGTAVFVGSEAARGAPALGMKRPVLASYSVEELKTFCDGSFFGAGKFDGALAYGQVKLVGALWLSELARRHPEVRLLTVSPGNTSGTEIARHYPTGVRLFLTYVFTPIIGPLLGAVHDLRHGAARIVGALSDAGLESGGFYASAPKKVIGPMVEQGALYPELKDPRIQKNAAAVVEYFARARPSTPVP